MFKMLMSTENITQWPTLGLAIFFCFFVAVLLWVVRPGSSSLYNKAANAIFGDEQRGS